MPANVFPGLLFLLILTSCSLDSQQNITDDPDWNKSIMDIIKSRGFDVDIHRVTTEDSYILQIFRVKCRKSCSERKIVLIPPPLLMDSAMFVIDYANNSIGYILADNGFDVWLGNWRGTKYGRESLWDSDPSSRDSKFFDFYTYDMATKDLPAMIDFITNATASPSIHYIGHSQATHAVFIMLSFLPQYNHKLTSIAAVAPFLKLSCHVGRGGLDTLSKETLLLSILKSLTNEVPPSYIPFSKLCSHLPSIICDAFMWKANGFTTNVNMSRLDIYLQHFPSPTSVKNLIYFSQLSAASCVDDSEMEAALYNYDSFRLWGFMSNNQKVYGQDSPPKSNMSLITTPVRLYYSTDDAYANVTGVNQLLKGLPNVDGSYHMGPGFHHIDMILTSFNVTHIYDIIMYFDKYHERHGMNIAHYEGGF